MEAITIPATLGEWELLRKELRVAFWGLLGHLPDLFTPQVQITHRVAREGYELQRLTFSNGIGDTVYGYLLIPEGLTTPAPAVLYTHMHGGKYDFGKNELFQDRFTDASLATTLTQAGYVVLAIDAYAFGERQMQGPAGERERGGPTELSLFKKFLWHGSTLWGMMLHDDMLALNYLVSLPQVDPNHIGVTGMSLGGSRATWLAALDERLKVTIPVAQMNRYRDFDAAGGYPMHGIYYYVPNVLAKGLDMEHLVALTAPRAQVILVGDSDALSPLSGIHKIDSVARQVYQFYQADTYQLTLYPTIGHEYTSPMYHAMLAALKQHLS